jgi:DNA-binding MarR family transcriptional regulator
VASTLEEELNPSVLERIAGYHLRRAYGAISTGFNRTFAGTGLRQVLFGITAIIAANPGINQGKVAQVLSIKRANMVALINELLDMGIIERRIVPTDRRSFSLHLTDQGTAEFARWAQQIDEHEKELFARFNPGERAILIELLGRLAGVEEPPVD